MITKDDVLDAHVALVPEGQTLADFGISLSIWVIRANCSRHGALMCEDITNGETPDVLHLICAACRRENVERRCPVRAFERIDYRGGKI